MQVIKRDGRVMEFNKVRIVDAIVKAMRQTKEGVDEELANKIASSIEKQLENREEVSVYEIQDLVEKKLMVSSRKEVATAYITYRYTRDVARKSKTKNMFLDIITSKSNSLLNKEGSYQNISEMMNNFAAESIKPYVDTILLSKDVKEAEKEGYIDIRNKSYYPTKAIRTFQIPLTPDSPILKDCCNMESAVSNILKVANGLEGEVCETIILPPLDDVIHVMEKKTYDEELKSIAETLQWKKENEKCIALAEKQAKNRVHHSLKFLFEGLASLRKRVTFLDSKSEVSSGNNVINAVKINLPKIAFEMLNYTKDTNERLTPHIETNEDEIIEKQFLSSLKKCITIAVKAMVERFNFQSTGTKNQFPTLMSGLWKGSENLNEDDTLESVLRNGTLELEVFGLEEAIIILLKQNDKVQKFKNVVMDEINQMVTNFSKEYELRFSWKETKENQEIGGEKNENS